MKQKEILQLRFALFFSIFFYLLVFHEPQTWGLMVIEKL
jgi:hypothetical protein